jgi:spore coat protein A
MLNRRDFLKAGSLVGVSLAAGCSLADEQRFRGAIDSPILTKFIDPLPIPGTMKASGSRRGATVYDIVMTQFHQQLHSQLPPTTVWGYNGTYPARTIEARQGKAVTVRWRNELPVEHLFDVDHTLHGAGYSNPDVRTVTHLHGGHVPPESDGYPEDWFGVGDDDVYYYPNEQRPTTLWYHDHALGITRLNVYAGLAGFYILREPSEARLKLPKNDYEIPIVIQDRTFQGDGQLWYPSELQPEFFGDTAVINGRAWPYLEVEPRRYRFRFLNGSNSRFYRMRLFESDVDGVLSPAAAPGPDFHQIGTDGGLLETPATRQRLLLAPGERADIVIDFGGMDSQNFVLRNNAPSPFKGSNYTDDHPHTDDHPNDDEFALPDLMQFRVQRRKGADPSRLPYRLSSIDRIPESSADKVRTLTLVEAEDELGRLKLLLGVDEPGKRDGLDWSAPTTELPELGTVEIWELLNASEDVHPIHLHLVMFQILDRQPFDVDEYLDSGDIITTGAAVPAEPYNQGWHDTVHANPGEITRIIAPFEDYAGRYVWHCHILEHEDHEMMRPLWVIDP